MKLEKTMTETLTEHHIRLTEEYGAHNYHPLPLVIERGQGVWVWDVEGRKYMDFLSAYSALNQGHCHPRMIQAVQRQMQNLTLTSRAFYNDQMGPYLKKLAGLCGMEMVLPMNSGAEGVETAIKTARKWGYQRKGVAQDRAEIVVFSGNFHGRTTTIVGFSSDPLTRNDFGPYGPGFISVPYGDLEATGRVLGPNTVAVLVEPIQGEAGVVLPPDGFLTGLRELCSHHNVLLVADEIQTGLGRTGRLFACEHENVHPDIYIIGKALSAGFYPVSAVVSSREILGVFTPGDHGSTFGGNPLACAIAQEALDIIIDEELPRRSADLGAYFQAKLQEIHSPHVEEVRGRGLFIGVVVKKSSGPARPFCKRLMKRGLLCKETHEQVVRLAPPLVVDRAELDWALEQIREVLLP